MAKPPILRVLHPFDDRDYVTTVMVGWRDLISLAFGRGVLIGQIGIARRKRKPISQNAALLIALAVGFAIGMLAQDWILP